MATTSCLGIIPARIGSTRFNRKILAPIAGKPMIQWVWEAAYRAKELDHVVVATDSPEIEAVVKGFGGLAELTGEFPNGTMRVASVAKAYDADIIVNIQGDEPLLQPADLDGLVASIKSNPHLGMSTLAWKCFELETVSQRDIVKVALSKSGEALYFSRSPIGPMAAGFYYRHVGIYAFRRAVLFDYCGWPISDLEKTEQLEQLRALENGVRCAVNEVSGPRVAVDLSSDIALVEKLLCSRKSSPHTEVNP